MPLIALAFVLLVPIVLVLAMPLGLVQRYRVGKARRLGRKWAATLNLVMLGLSVAIFLWAAAITNYWVPKAFLYSMAGIATGGLLGFLGLILTHWEEAPRTLHYTPNRWLILIITLAVTTRLLYGFWRGWQAWTTAGPDTSWLVAAGAANSMAVGAVVLGYYLTYAAGVYRRLGRHRRQWGQVM